MGNNRLISRMFSPFRSKACLDERLARIEHKVTLIHEERRAQEAWQRQADIRIGRWLDEELGKLDHKLSLVLQERRAQEAWQRDAEVRISRRLFTLEHLGRGGHATYVGGERLLTRAVIGGHTFAFFLEADDRLLTPWFVVSGAYETVITEYLLRELRRDSHSVDVGANFGYFTCLMAKFAPEGRVIGIEPDERVQQLARDNTLINGVETSAEIIHAAAADQSGELTLYRRIGRSGNNSLAKPAADFTALLGEPPSTPFTVNSVRIDDLLPRMDGRIDLIKLDVEGAEPLVLAGAGETIRRNPQLRIVMEWSPGQVNAAGVETADFVRQISETGLRAFDIVDDGLTMLSTEALLNIPYRTGIVLMA